MYLLDTNILSEIIKKNPNKNLISKLGAAPSPTIFTATICVMELRHGAMKRGNPSDFWLIIEQQILSKVRILDFSYPEALKAGELIHQLYSLGRPIGIEDIMIGSIALCNNLTIISGNTKHFQQILGLRVENWLN
jgi:predicted nucleic acid-binding protein